MIYCHIFIVDMSVLCITYLSHMIQSYKCRRNPGLFVGHVPVEHLLMYVTSATDSPTDFSCQTRQVIFRIYLPKLKFGCPQEFMCLAMPKF